MIRVLHFLSDSNIGGAGITLYRLLSSSDRDRFDFAVVLPENSETKQLFEGLGIPVYEYGSSSDRSFSIVSIFEFFSIIRDFSPHIVHTHGSISARISAYLSGVRSRVYSRHTSRCVKPSVLLKLLNRKITTRAVYVNECMKEQMECSGVGDIAELIVNGCESFYTAKKVQHLPPRYLYYGRIVRSKGVFLILDALNKLSEIGMDYSLRIVGDGHDYESLVEYSKKLKLSDKVKFESYNNDVRTLLSECDVLLLPSLENEGTSNSLIEAMSAGVPCVVSSADGNIHTVTHKKDGVVFEKGDASSFAQAILFLNDEHTYRNISEQAIKTYRERFTIDVFSRKYADLWEEEYKRYYEKQ